MPNNPTPETPPQTDNKTGVQPELEPGIKHSTSLIIMKKPTEIYQFWRDLTNLPRFMWHLQKIDVTSPTESHWTYKALLDNITVEWDSEIIQDEPGKAIAWKAKKGSSVEHSGDVTFEELPYNRGTMVRLNLSYNPPGGKLTDFFAKMIGESPEATFKEDLRRLRQLLEAGVIATTEGQPHGERGITDRFNPLVHHS